MINHNLTTKVSLEKISGKGEDGEPVIHYDGDVGAIKLAVFDGLGGYVAGFGDERGGRIASRIASQVTYDVFRNSSNDSFNKEDALKLEQSINTTLKSEIPKIENPEYSNFLLCSTIAFANIIAPNDVKDTYKVQVGWMGDSQIHFLSSSKGLQQLTLDDSWRKRSRPGRPRGDFIDEESWKNMNVWKINNSDLTGQCLKGYGKYGDDESINFKEVIFNEPGCVVLCTDGAYCQRLVPRLLERDWLGALQQSESIEEFQQNLVNHYHDTGFPDDAMTLLVQPVGFKDFQDFKESYAERYKIVKFYDFNPSRFAELPDEEISAKAKEHEQNIWLEHYRDPYAEHLFKFSESESSNFDPNSVLDKDNKPLAEKCDINIEDQGITREEFNKSNSQSGRDKDDDSAIENLDKLHKNESNLFEPISSLLKVSTMIASYILMRLAKAPSLEEIDLDEIAIADAVRKVENGQNVVVIKEDNPPLIILANDAATEFISKKNFERGLPERDYIKKLVEKDPQDNSSLEQNITGTDPILLG